MAGKRRAKGRLRFQGLTLCISTTMVLILIGMVVVSVQVARGLSAYVKENLGVTLTLDDKVSDEEALSVMDTLATRPYCKSAEYISKEQARQEQSEALGSDPSEFLGFNPFTATIEMRLRADYANGDSLAWIAPALLAEGPFTDVAFQEDLMDQVNANLRRIGAILIVLAVLLTCVSFALINNTVRLGIYSRRFIIHTMKLVGASWPFIRRPFIRSAVAVGLLASLIACGVLAAGVYALYDYEPGIRQILGRQEMAVAFVAVFLFGVLITVACSYVSVNRFLRMTAGEIYNS